jgi:hypothetical protein
MRSTSRGASRSGPASEPSEDIRYLVRRLADDRPLPERTRLVAKQLVGGQKQFGLAAANLCEGGRLLARRLYLPDEVARALGQMTARWDGKGVPGDVAGEELSRPLRIVRVAHDLLANTLGDFVSSLAHRIARFPAAGQVVVKERVNAIALAPAEDFRLDSDLFSEGVRTRESQGRIQAAMKRGFQNREAEMALARTLDGLAER